MKAYAKLYYDGSVPFMASVDVEGFVTSTGEPVSGMDANTARWLAAELVKAADEADRLAEAARLPERLAQEQAERLAEVAELEQHLRAA